MCIHFKAALFIVINLLMLSACQPVPVQVETPLAATAAQTTATAAPNPTETTPATPIPTPTSQPFPSICSPLQGYDLDDLRGQISNAYHPPAPGSDDPHQGVDLADFLPADKIALTGREVQAVTAGTVTGVIQDRFPYGNAVMVELPLAGQPGAWVAGLNLPAPLTGETTGGALTCPAFEIEPGEAEGQRSIYILYAHLLEQPEVAVGDSLDCGQTLGKVGQSGNALSPHLHLEVRVGPAGTRWPSMAHYDVSATGEEMGAYCLWRVSGRYQTIDPFCLLEGCRP